MAAEAAGRTITPDQLKMIRMLARAGFLFLFIAALYLSLADIRETPGLEFTWDKLNHAFGYALLIASGDIGFRTGRSLALKTVLVFSYSMMLEVAQYFLPFREFSLLDLAANALGIGFFLLLRIGLKRLSIYRDLEGDSREFSLSGSRL